VIIEVPVGKKIEIDESIHNYGWFNINMRRNGWNITDNDEWNDERDDRYDWDANTEYIMTTKGLERTDKKYQNDEEENEHKTIIPKSDKGYRYKSADSSKPKNQQLPVPKKDSATQQKSVRESEKKSEEKTALLKKSNNDEGCEKASAPGYFLSMILQ
jgi:hypothetical protein